MKATRVLLSTALLVSCRSLGLLCAMIPAAAATTKDEATTVMLPHSSSSNNNNNKPRSRGSSNNNNNNDALVSVTATPPSTRSISHRATQRVRSFLQRRRRVSVAFGQALHGIIDSATEAPSAGAGGASTTGKNTRVSSIFGDALRDIAGSPTAAGAAAKDPSPVSAKGSGAAAGKNNGGGGKSGKKGATGKKGFSSVLGEGKGGKDGGGMMGMMGGGMMMTSSSSSKSDNAPSASASKTSSSSKTSKGAVPSPSSSKGVNDIVSDFCRAFTFHDRQAGQENCSPNVLDVARQFPEQLSVFVDLVQRAGLEEVFDCAGPFTVFAPDNEAFYAVDPRVLAELLQTQNQGLLQELLLYHILPGVILADDFADGMVETLSGEDILVTEPPLQINDAIVLDADLLGCNGVLHVVDSILIPEVGDVVEPEPGFCDVFTFEDRRRLQDGGEDCTPNILDVARGDQDLSIVVDLMERVELDTIFQCAGPFTLLLPTDDAFLALGDNSLEVLRDPDNFNVVQDILLYHILPRAIGSTEFEAGPTETLFTPADVLVSLGPIMFNTASVLEADVTGCNGIYHVVDQLLVPGGPAPPTTTPPAFCDDFTFEGLQDGVCSPNILEVAFENNDDLSLIVSLFRVAGLEDIFDCPGPFTVQLPTNEAFMAVDPNRLEFLLMPENIGELRDLLLYHVIPRDTLTSDFAAGPTETLLEGFPVEISFSPSIMFDDGSVEEANLSACNGRLNILDTVLDPFEEVLDETPTAAPVVAPTGSPTTAPTSSPTDTAGAPTGSPTTAPTSSPTSTPSASPSATPSSSPSVAPSASP